MKKHVRLDGAWREDTWVSHVQGNRPEEAKAHPACGGVTLDARPIGRYGVCSKQKSAIKKKLHLENVRVTRSTIGHGSLSAPERVAS
ncbi:unnamed protein product [Urochloa humidicola]